MTDTVDAPTRSRMMASVRSRNSRIEIAVRRRLFALGLRYRLHRRDLPGTPDFVFPKHRSAVFVHGCFWHLHGCELSSIPATRPDWWRQKLERNAERDAEAVSRLRRLGWRVLTIWECRFRRAGVNRDRALDEACREAAAFVRSSNPVLEIPRSSSARRTPGPDS